MSVEGAGERQKGAALSDTLGGFFVPATLYAKEQVCGSTRCHSAPSVHPEHTAFGDHAAPARRFSSMLASYP